ncbi:16004_t:CDS:2 [Gigaspora rosea]|nr:16004_t:CDS:2 [Gigaspora rosea]
MVWELPNKYKWLENKLQELKELEKSQIEKLFSEELNWLKEKLVNYQAKPKGSSETGPSSAPQVNYSAISFGFNKAVPD